MKNDFWAATPCPQANPRKTTTAKIDLRLAVLIMKSSFQIQGESPNRTSLSQIYRAVPDTDTGPRTTFHTTVSCTFRKDPKPGRRLEQQNNPLSPQTQTVEGNKDGPLAKLRSIAGTPIDTSCIKICQCVFPYLSVKHFDKFSAGWTGNPIATDVTQDFVVKRQTASARYDTVNQLPDASETRFRLAMKKTKLQTVVYGEPLKESGPLSSRAEAATVSERACSALRIEIICFLPHNESPFKYKSPFDVSALTCVNAFRQVNLRSVITVWCNFTFFRK